MFLALFHLAKRLIKLTSSAAFENSGPTDHRRARCREEAVIDLIHSSREASFFVHCAKSPLPLSSHLIALVVPSQLLTVYYTHSPSRHPSFGLCVHTFLKR